MYYEGDRMNGGVDADMLTDVVKGAIAGAVGVWAMDKVVWWMWNREDPAALEQERQARPGGMDPAHNIANRVAGAMGKELSPAQPHPAGVAVHYGLGVMPGAAYAVLRKRVPVVGAGGGLLYGLAMTLMEDEGVSPLLGLAGAPTEYPWQAHLRGVVGHMVLGAVTHATLDLLDRAA